MGGLTLVSKDFFFVFATTIVTAMQFTVESFGKHGNDAIYDMLFQIMDGTTLRAHFAVTCSNNRTSNVDIVSKMFDDLCTKKSHAWLGRGTIQAI